MPGNLSKSDAYHEAARGIIPGGVNSNVRLGGWPLCFESARGPILVDLDGNEYVDYALGMGPAILGHAPSDLIAAVQASLSSGQLFAGQHRSELDLARLLQRYIPSAELVRIGMTGSEMVQAALRVARAFTGKNGFIKFEGQYHGWFDNVLVNLTGTPGNGVVPLPVRLQTKGQAEAGTADTHILPWNDLDVVERYLADRGDQVAALITEPVMCNTGVIPPRPGYLEGLRSVCDKHKVVFIFDEVITGFRLGLGGAQGKFGVTPDLSTFAKAFGGGFPLAALAGRREIMSLFASGEVNHSGTYNSNLVSIVAGIATLEQLAANDGEVYRRIDGNGIALIEGMREIAQRRSVNLQVSGYGAVFHTYFADDLEIVDYASHWRADATRQAAFVDALLPLGIRPTRRGTWFVSGAHGSSEIDRTLSAVDEVLRNGLN
ncbi:aspartate aminotransferase family protein [Novosphingobium mathurense]|uniref:aspartate aminotransferase family protein n=1 Tax=Novosphingobium mathurense TaxID=428990 RepID=UPI001C377C8E|nr:aminotransferase class III-fold pyridoxal phosphate-dependent enzyme [Novosphingobium mathurense]